MRCMSPSSAKQVAGKAGGRSTLPADPAKLTPVQVLCLEGYYALRQSLAPEDIGAEEIRRWIQNHKDIRRPSGATVLLALTLAQVPHRGRGRPKGGRGRLSREGSPFLPPAPRSRNG